MSELPVTGQCEWIQEECPWAIPSLLLLREHVIVFELEIPMFSLSGRNKHTFACGHRIAFADKHAKNSRWNRSLISPSTDHLENNRFFGFALDHIAVR